MDPPPHKKSLWCLNVHSYASKNYLKIMETFEKHWIVHHTKNKMWYLNLSVCTNNTVFFNNPKGTSAYEF